MTSLSQVDEQQKASYLAYWGSYPLNLVFRNYLYQQAPGLLI